MVNERLAHLVGERAQLLLADGNPKTDYRLDSKNQHRVFAETINQLAADRSGLDATLRFFEWQEGVTRHLFEKRLGPSQSLSSGKLGCKTRGLRFKTTSTEWRSRIKPSPQCGLSSTGSSSNSLFYGREDGPCPEPCHLKAQALGPPSFWIAITPR